LTEAAFFDTNVPLYLLSSDAAKAERAERALADGGVVSVQVLGEFVAVARRRRTAPWPTIVEALAGLRAILRVEPLTLAVHDRALALARRHDFHIYDATIVASALVAGCRTLYSEDFQHGQVVEGLTIVNPFC
jgi:predicted nucleic acid-binding protein